MATPNLNGRLHRLEAAMSVRAGPGHCRACGLRHVQPLTLALVRSVLRVAGGGDDETSSPPPLCLCEPCCGGKDHWLARLSHGLPPEEGAA
jgi:hypothetical protein